MYIEGIGDEVTNFFILLITFLIVYFGWQTTRVRDQAVGVLIIENRNIPVRRSESSASNRTETEEFEAVNNVLDELEDDITNFVTATTTAEQPVEELGAEENIIQRMDQPDGAEVKDDDGLRHRTTTTTDVPKDEREMTIKLKYLNDEMKFVTGKSSEAIGDFKKRNFTVELAAQKLVRLVFNGHVLQPDRKTLEECGLFDNCVVHCLIHNPKPPTNAERAATESSNNQSQAATGIETPATENFRPEHGRWYLYVGMVFISLTLVFCWFCRVQYAYLFSFYSTVGLVLMSVLFVAMIPLILLIERDVVG